MCSGTRTIRDTDRRNRPAVISISVDAWTVLSKFCNNASLCFLALRILVRPLGPRLHGSYVQQASRATNRSFNKIVRCNKIVRNCNKIVTF